MFCGCNVQIAIIAETLGSGCSVSELSNVCTSETTTAATAAANTSVDGTASHEVISHYVHHVVLTMYSRGISIAPYVLSYIAATYLRLG